MAKVSLNKALIKKAQAVKTVTINEQEIEILQYLPIDEKSNYITAVMSSAIDDNNIFSPIRIKVYSDLNLIKFYTNFNLTDKMYNDPSKTYDALVINNIIDEVRKNIPVEELEFLNNALMACVNDLRTYNQSAAGVLKQITTDYQNTEMDVDKLIQEVGDPEQLKFVRDILTKLG